MKLRQILQQADLLLQSHKIDNPGLTAEVILRYTLNLSKVKLYQEFDSEISPDKLEYFKIMIERSIKGEPVAYIIGHKEFYGIDFNVDKRALIPRPETELIVDKAIEIATKRKIKTIADVGTGSGAIAIALALNLRWVRFYATDISAEAMELALQNCSKHHLLDRITFLEGDMVEPLPEPMDLITANLPYVEGPSLYESSIMYEPELALNGGDDGLVQIRRFISGVSTKLKNNGVLLMEIGVGQTGPVTSLLHSIFNPDNVVVFKDLGGIDRVIKASL